MATTVLERPFSCLEILVHTTDPESSESKRRADARKTSSREEVDFRDLGPSQKCVPRFQSKRSAWRVPKAAIALRKTL